MCYMGGKYLIIFKITFKMNFYDIFKRKKKKTNKMNTPFNDRISSFTHRYTQHSVKLLRD